MIEMKKKIYYGLFYLKTSLKGADSLAIIASLVSAIFINILKGKKISEMIDIITVASLFLIFLFFVGINEFQKKVNVPFLLVRNSISLNELKEVMEKYNYKSWNIDTLQKVFGASAFDERKLVSVEFSFVNCIEDLRSFAEEMYRKLHFIGKELIGINNTIFHIYITKETPTAAALIAGTLLGDERLNFIIYAENINADIDRILVSEEIESKIEKNMPNSFQTKLIARIYDKDYINHKELELDELTNLIVEKKIQKLILIVDLTSSSLQKSGIDKAIESNSINQYLIVTTKKKSSTTSI
jgi:hypothetical protein